MAGGADHPAFVEGDGENVLVHLCNVTIARNLLHRSCAFVVSGSDATQRCLSLLIDIHGFCPNCP